MTATLPKPKFPRAAALAVAKELCDALKPFTERLIVAGSLRRRRESVGDVEILYIPQIIQGRRKDDLFGPPESINCAENCITGLVHASLIRPRENIRGSTTWGDKNKLALHVASGIPVDLFATTEAAWFNYLVCRTGPAESNTRIAARALERGWHWHPYAKGFTDEEGNPVTVKSEQDLFELLNLPYLEPWER